MVKRRKERAKSIQFTGNVPRVDRAFAEADWDSTTSPSDFERGVVWVFVGQGNTERICLAFELSGKIYPRSAAAGT